MRRRRLAAAGQGKETSRKGERERGSFFRANPEVNRVEDLASSRVCAVCCLVS